MNWEEVGAIGQVLGSLAVFITLGYLAVQVRQARDEVRRSVGQSRVDIARQLTTRMFDSERLNALTVQAREALRPEPVSEFTSTLMQIGGLTREDAAMLGSYQRAWWQYRVQMISQVDHLAREERAEFDDLIVADGAFFDIIDDFFYAVAGKLSNKP